MRRIIWHRFGIAGIAALVLALGIVGLHEMDFIGYQPGATIAGFLAFAGLFLLIFLFAFPAAVSGIYRGLGGEQSALVHHVHSYVFFFDLLIIEDHEKKGKQE